MIRRLNEADRRALSDLLEQAPALNLYQQGNLETLGFSRHYCAFWGDFDEGGSLRGCSNRYMSGWSVFGLAGADWDALAGLVDGDPQAERLQDNPGGIGSLLPYLHRTVYSSVEEELMQLAREDFRPVMAATEIEVRQATMNDLPALIDLYADAGQMGRSPAAVERPLRDGTVFLAALRSPGRDTRAQVVSAALTNAQTSSVAMIGGVYTRTDVRGRGYSQAVCSALCNALLSAKLAPVLYWKTPAAGRVYRKLGFRPIGMWRSAWLVKPPDE